MDPMDLGFPFNMDSDEEGRLMDTVLFQLSEERPSQKRRVDSSTSRESKQTAQESDYSVSFPTLYHD